MARLPGVGLMQARFVPRENSRPDIPTNVRMQIGSHTLTDTIRTIAKDVGRTLSNRSFCRSTSVGGGTVRGIFFGQHAPAVGKISHRRMKAGFNGPQRDIQNIADLLIGKLMKV